MNKSEKEIIKQFPNATDRKRIRDYDYRQYYGEYPDDPDFYEELKRDGWKIVAISSGITVLLGLAIYLVLS